MLGPALRYAGETEALIWVGTDAPCTVSVHGCEATTFCVEGHHYALVECAGLEPGTITPYDVHLDGEQVWPLPDSPYPPSVIRTHDPERPTETVADFEEYTRLYWESWGQPYMRWLLSTVPSSMNFDDHDVHDDWNTSKTWVTDIRGQGWWDDRIVGGFMSYWCYQHLGNLSPRELADYDVYHRVREADDGSDILNDYVFKADREVEGTRWSFCRDIGSARLVMVDSRAGRVLDPGARSMVDEDEWRWIEEQARGDCKHLLIGTSVPLLLAPGMHYLEAWNEALCDGAWGPVGAHYGERLRQGLDLEHWAAFGESLERMMGIVRAVGTGERGEPPASIVALSGDVHHAYLAEVAFPKGTGMRSTTWQATCSPFRNPLDDKERTVMRFMASAPARVIMRGLARLAGVEDPSIRWRYTHDEPWFDNQVATLELDDRRARVVLEKTLPPEDGEHPALRLERVYERDLC